MGVGDEGALYQESCQCHTGYRIDMYLQVMQRCTPNISDSINELFFLLASRLMGMFYDEEPNPENPVPVEIQIDAVDLLGREIENYFLARDVVLRTIDILFNKPAESGGGDRDGGGKTSAADLPEFYSHCEDDQGQNL